MNLSDNQNNDTIEMEKKSKNNTSTKNKIETNQKEKIMETYLKLDDGIGTLEVDLVLMRERGQVIKFLDITFAGTNPETGQLQSSKKVIESKEDFEQLKTFINQLDWEKL